MIVSAGPSADTTMRTWPLCVGCTTKLVSYTLVTAPHTVSLDAKFSGKGPGFCVLRVSLQCLTDTRQMHVGVPLYREHEALVRLVAVPAAAIMWRNLLPFTALAGPVYVPVPILPRAAYPLRRDVP